MVLAASGLILSVPVLMLAGLAVWLEDGRSPWFVQTRVGRNGKPFQLIKIRSMKKNAAGMALTVGRDSRVTRVGRIVRKFKLDELPQLWSVVKGDMALVGPRPEVPRYVNGDDPIWRRILEWRPGITDLATLVYKNEEEILASAADPDRYYREVVLPEKLALNLVYLEVCSLWSDLKLILLTMRYSFWPVGFDPLSIRRKFVPEEFTRGLRTYGSKDHPVSQS